MNKLNKILWGILSIGISAIYRTDAGASTFSGMNSIPNNLGDIINVTCDFGTIKLKVTKYHGKVEGGKAGGTCSDDAVCATTDATNSCSKKYTATNTSTAIKPSELKCTTLTCPNSGNIDNYAFVTKKTLNLTNEFGCVKSFEGGHQTQAFSYTVIDTAAASGWYASYTAGSNGSYIAYWSKLTNNSINDCYIAPGTYTDSNGNTYQQVDTDNKCYYKG